MDIRAAEISAILKSQIEGAVNSVCRNIAEGFGCGTHAEFARFLGISRRSLNELQDALRGALLKRCQARTCTDERQTRACTDKSQFRTDGRQNRTVHRQGSGSH